MTTLADRMCPIRPVCDAPLRRGRNGYTLVELLVVISLVSMVFTAVTLTLHLLQRVNNQLRNEIPQSDAMLRLTLRVRADAHQATQFSTETSADGGPVARFHQPTGVDIVYQKQSSTIVRTVHHNNQQVHQDRFRCAHEAELNWLTEGDPPSIVSMVLKRNRSRQHDGSDSIQFDRVDAALGTTAGATK